MSISFLYVAPEHRDGEPIEEAWINRAGSEDFAGLVDYEEAYQPGARRFDVGQRSSFQLVPMAVAALEQVLEWDPERIAASLAVTTAAIADGAAALGLDAAPADQRGPHMLGLPIPDGADEPLRESLTEAQVFAAVRGNALRIGPHLHNTSEDIERLLAALGDGVELTWPG